MSATLEAVSQQLESLDKKLDTDYVKTAEIAPLQKELNELKAKVKSETKFTLPADAKRYTALKNLKTDEQAYRFGKWCLSAIGDNRKWASDVTAKATEFCKEHGLTKAHTEGTNTAGGYLVPDEFDSTMIDLREQYGVFRRNAKVVPMASETKSFPRRTAGLTVYLVGENTAITESTKSWDRINLVAKKWGVLSKYSSELNEDAVINIGDDLAGEIAYAFANKEDECGFNGTGANTTYLGITGVRQKLIDINGVDEGGGLILQTSNAFADITLADFHKVIGLLPQYADTPNAKWYMHRTFWASVAQRLQTAAGGNDASNIAAGARNPSFLGYPVELSQVFPATDTASVVYALFGDLAMAAVLGDRRSTTIAFSEHLNFAEDEIAIRGTQRIDINVHDVGTATAPGPIVGLVSSAS